MNRRTRDLRIRGKLATGALPWQPFPRVWAGTGDGHACDGCDETVERVDLAMEGTDSVGRPLRLHVECFRAWEDIRDRGMAALASGGPAPRWTAEALSPAGSAGQH